MIKGKITTLLQSQYASDNVVQPCISMEAYVDRASLAGSAQLAKPNHTLPNHLIKREQSANVALITLITQSLKNPVPQAGGC